jgi:hypothetical protein
MACIVNDQQIVRIVVLVYVIHYCLINVKLWAFTIVDAVHGAFIAKLLLKY